MKITGIKEREGTLKKLKNLLADESTKIQGAFYTNSFFSQRYVSRPQTTIGNIDIKESRIDIKVTTRVESVGMMEIENTYHVLTEYEAGDMPGFTPESFMDEGEENMDEPHIPEVLSVDAALFSVDILLRMKDVKLTYQEFTIAGIKFTLVNLHNKIDEDEEGTGFDQTVSLLFGPADKLYFFSNFVNKKMTSRDARLIMDLIADENITGKPIKVAQLMTDRTAVSLSPQKGLVDCFLNYEGALIFQSGLDFILVEKPFLDKGTFEILSAMVAPGRFFLIFKSGEELVITIE